MSDPAVIYELSRGVATLTLNRPDNKNALSHELVSSLRESVDRAEKDENARVIVLTNNGNTFCAGADLKESKKENSVLGLAELFTLMRQASKPIIGKIVGHCMGGGVGLAASCDLSVMQDDVKLGFTEVRLGVAAAVISVVCLPKMRQADAMELFLSGERISPDRAAEVGLINYAVKPEEVDSKVRELAKKITMGGPIALAKSKELVYQIPKMSVSEAFEYTSQLSAKLFVADEAREGISAFREKRLASWVPSDE